MTKKIFLGMSAMAMLFATSCKDDFAESFVGDQATVEFSISTPEIGTRAYSDGTTATKLQYAVYDAAGEELTALTETDGEINGSTTVTLDLTTGETYSVIFWAAAENAPYTVNFASKTMTVNYNGAVSNDESRDAFYKYHTFTVSGAQTENIELKRPFAQLNIGTEDYQKATEAGYTPTKSAVTVKNIYSTLNLASGAVSDDVEVTFDYNAIPGKVDNVDAEDFPVAGYEYLAMNYLLVGADQEVVDIEFGYTETDATAAKIRTVGSVPVQRNYRTNIYGKLLTSTVDVNVEIEPDFDEPAHGLAALQNAALNGGEVTLSEDITLTTPLEVYGKMTINLNGKTISAAIHKNDGPIIKNNGTLTINGGTISSTANNGGSAIQNNGTLEIEGTILNGAPNADGSWPSYTVNNTGTMTAKNAKITSYHGAVASYGEGAVVTLNDCEIDMAGIPGFTSHGIYTYNNGKVIVNGGTYANKATDQASSGASVINGAVEVNAGTFSGRIENYYGTPVLKGGNFTVDPTRFVADGCKVEENDGLYYVLATSVSTANQLYKTLSVMTEIGSTEEIKLTEDINLSGIEWNQIGTSEKPFAGTLNGNGKKISNLTIANTEYAALIAYTAENAKIKNLILENVNIRSDKHAAGVVCVAGEGLTIENVKVSGVITAASYAGGIVHNAANVTIKNCENNATVSANRAGGIASWVTVGANIENVINTGDITGGVGAAGIAHGFAGSIKNAVNKGNIKSNNVEAAAGIAGVQKAASTYEYCYNYGNVTSTYDDANASAAGILGQSAGTKSTLKYCANYGNITAVASYAAGIAYSLYGTINASYCYNEGAVNGADGAGAIAPKAQYGAGDKASYCLNAGTITSSNGIVYQGSNNNTSCYYYDGNVLKSVSGNTETTTETAMSVLNGGTDTEFFSVENGKICVK